MSDQLIVVLLALGCLGWVVVFALGAWAILDRRRSDRRIASLVADYQAERERRMDAEARARGVGGLNGAKPSIRRISL